MFAAIHRTDRPYPNKPFLVFSRSRYSHTVKYSGLAFEGGRMKPRGRRYPSLVILLLSISFGATAAAQRGGPSGRGGPPQPPATPKAQASFDLTGYWVSLVNEDWRYRMTTAPKGDYA